MRVRASSFCDVTGIQELARIRLVNDATELTTTFNDQRPPLDETPYTTTYKTDIVIDLFLVCSTLNLTQFSNIIVDPFVDTQ